MSDYCIDTCYGVYEETIRSNQGLNINVIKRIKKYKCIRANDCLLYKRKNKRCILKPTKTMVQGECSHFKEKPEDTKIENLFKNLQYSKEE